jgi:hypothetical protein
VRDSAIVLIAVAGTAALYRFKHHNSIRNHVGAVVILDTLKVNKGTERYRVEPGKDYVPVSETARWARVESVGGNWFAISKSDGTVYRDCAKEPVDIAIANKPEVSPFRVRACGNGRRLLLSGR